MDTELFFANELGELKDELDLKPSESNLFKFKPPPNWLFVNVAIPAGLWLAVLPSLPSAPNAPAMATYLADPQRDSCE